MKTSTNYRHPASGSGGWPPGPAPALRAPGFTHWLTRAARGHTWNGDGVSRGNARHEHNRHRPH